MSDRINDGGPAFPPVHDPESHPSGMTLRDYFAAKAMQAFLAQTEADDPKEWPVAAAVAYGVADAMLKARGVE